MTRRRPVNKMKFKIMGPQQVPKRVSGKKKKTREKNKFVHTTPLQLELMVLWIKPRH
ncbi:hypothetical protein PC128_g21207 [Phytophthora cactorum]|nr:hypothetical protein PC128_g21207 [Phytophthora cactorum]